MHLVSGDAQKHMCQAHGFQAVAGSSRPLHPLPQRNMLHNLKKNLLWLLEKAST